MAQVATCTCCTAYGRTLRMTCFSIRARRLAWVDALYNQPEAAIHAPTRGRELLCSTMSGGVHALLDPVAKCLRGVHDTMANDSGSAAFSTKHSTEQPQLFAAALTAALSASSTTFESGASLEAGANGSRGSKIIADATAAQTARLLPSRSRSDIYYRRELLTRSLDGRRIDLLTITGTNEMLSSTEEGLPTPLLPEGCAPLARPRATAHEIPHMSHRPRATAHDSPHTSPLQLHNPAEERACAFTPHL